jgi:hypothetical protein
LGGRLQWKWTLFPIMLFDYISLILAKESSLEKRAFRIKG